MSNPVLTRLRSGLAAGAARAGSEASQARERLAAAGGVGENDLVRLRVDAVGRLVAVRFGPAVTSSTPPGWSTAVLSAYTAACRDVSRLPPRPGTAGPATPHRPGTAGAQAERARRLAAELPQTRVEAEEGGVAVELTGQQRLSTARVTAEALLGGPDALGLALAGAWRAAADEIERRVRAELGPSVGPGGSGDRR